MGHFFPLAVCTLMLCFCFVFVLYYQTTLSRQGPDGMPRIFNLYDQPHMDGGKLDEMMESLRSQLPGGGMFSLGGGSMDGRYVLATYNMSIICPSRAQKQPANNNTALSCSSKKPCL